MPNAHESLRRILGTPDQLETRLGTLSFVDGVPSAETAETVYEHLDFVHGLTLTTTLPWASTYAIRKGFHDVGVEDNHVLLFSELMGSESVFLTANGVRALVPGVHVPCVLRWRVHRREGRRMRRLARPLGGAPTCSERHTFAVRRVSRWHDALAASEPPARGAGARNEAPDADREANR